VLLKTDADIQRRNLAGAVAIARDQARKQRDDEALKREQAKQERIRQIAEARIEAERAKADLARAKAETNKVKSAEKRRQQRSEPGEEIKRRRHAITAHISDIELSELVERFKKAETMCAEGIERWIEGSIAKAIVLYAARNKFPSDPEFGAWLDENKICINHSDRAALIGLGSFGESRIREILSTAGSRSYQVIWNTNKLRIIEASPVS
jgi:hypothetical protein